jgi:hypothetical protein
VTPYDIVVPVREGADHPQLRYALRSWAAHLPHVRVWVVGHLPSWVVGVRHIPMVDVDSAQVHTWAAVRAACLEPAVSDPFLLCGDHMFVTAVQQDMPILNRGLLRDGEDEKLARVGGAPPARVLQTREILERMGYADPLSFELHVPLPMDKAEALRAIDVGVLLGLAHHTRTLYGNLTGLGGEHIGDVMVAHRGPWFGPPRGRFLATTPDSFKWGVVGTVIRSRFPMPCTYEQRRG